eukprot:SAG31_NODE_611_length_13558_cov_224.959730_15_plen_157_part_00
MRSSQRYPASIAPAECFKKIDLKNLLILADSQGAENEAVEQVAFADRILLNKTDLVTAEDLLRIEARLKCLNAVAPIKRCTKAQVAVDLVLDIGAFDLTRTLDMDPGTFSHHLCLGLAHLHRNRDAILSTHGCDGNALDQIVFSPLISMQRISQNF